MLEHFVKSLDGVDEKYHDLYTETDDGYEIQVKGVGEMKRAKAREKQRAQEAEDKLKEIQGQFESLRDEMSNMKDKKHKETGDIEALEKSWAEKMQKLEAEKNQAIEVLTGNLNKLLVDSEAMRLASELAVEGSADVLVPHIKSRLSADNRDGQYKTVVLDGEGKPSALTIDELKNEISGNKAFAPLLAGSRASGSGAMGGQGGGAAPSGNMGGSKDERIQALRSKFPDLANA